jgi:hypothetical protein
MRLAESEFVRLDLAPGGVGPSAWSLADLSALTRDREPPTLSEGLHHEH